MNETSPSSTQSSELVFPRAHRLMLGLTWMYASAVLAVWLWLILGAFGLPMAREWNVGGLGAIVLPALLVALTGSAATRALTRARFRYAGGVEGQRPEAQWGDSMAKLHKWWTGGVETPRTETRWGRAMANPGFAARQGQAVIVTTGALLVWIAERSLWPSQAVPAEGSAGGVAAAFAFGLAFVSLIAERIVNAFPEPQLQEAPKVRRLLLFTTLVLVAAACLEMARSVGVTWVRWPMLALACLPGVIMLELDVRALARLFLPPPLPAAATAVTDSLAATLITGGSRSPGALVRTHFGLDFSRSWALTFLSKALLPAAFGTGLLCWILSGVKLIDLGQRGIYERFGAPVAVLGPGLHLILPWPLGRLRPVEYGRIHSVAIGVDQAEPDESMVPVSAEAPPPIALNRLWESSHPGQAHYLVPSAGTGQQGFQSIATEISVLYRVGLTDSAAMQSVYSVADQELLIKDEADSLVLNFFNSRTLETVIGARRENVAASLRNQLAAKIDSYHAGIEIVSVLIEEIHPPVGAASAYHGVQAAEINATASIFSEQAKAELTAGVAQQEAQQMTSAADAKAAEIQDAADAEAYRFNADRRAFAAGGKAYLTERYYGNLDSALTKVPVTILDHRLNSAEGPILDLRATTPSIGGGKPAAAAPLIPGIESGH